MNKIKKNDNVLVLSGKDRGKQGQVRRVIPKESRAIVNGVNIVKKHQRQTQTSAGGILEIEAFLHVSNVAHVDPKDNKPTRVGFKTLEDGRKVRVAKRSGEVIDL
jgi:large subunit ribosomal protein L24